MDERFWSKVKKAPGCWWWRGARTGKWHPRGQFWLDGKNELAHRVSWALAHGPIPEGKSVLHHCDNSLCVRPGHLFLGDQFDNMQDASQKGRIAAQRRPFEAVKNLGSRRVRGEEHGSAKLTQTFADEIRANYALGCYTKAQLAVAYGVGETTIRDIIANRRWAALRKAVDDA